MTTKRVLIGSPIRQKPEILLEFLTSLQSSHRAANTQNITIDYYFIDDNDDTHSSELLTAFSEHNIGSLFLNRRSGGRTIIMKNVNSDKDQYLIDDLTHYWNDDLIWKVAGFKNNIIKHALDNNYDYLFLIDSDILINPNTIIHLIGTNKDIISEIFWTKWKPDKEPLPQVWLYDFYTLYEIGIDENINDLEKLTRQNEFLDGLKVPGVYEVGGLGACTLLSLSALKKGVNFDRIKNLTFWGEDRHFCIRAAALGLQLWVDTNYPAYHIYREADLANTVEFKKNNNLINDVPYKTIINKEKKQKLVVGMCIHNEANNFLTEVLSDIKQYADHVVIVDDASTDNSSEICKKILEGLSFEIIRNEISKFSNEVVLRKQLWCEIIKNEPDWIIILDADEIFEKKFKLMIRELMNQCDDTFLYSFRLYDFWNKTQYREDESWCAHLYYRPFLVKYKKDFDYTWRDTKQHCGRFPNNIYQLNNKLSDLRLKHFGWSVKTLRERKYNRYMELDPDGKCGILEQYQSILDENVNLKDFIEN